MTHLRSAATATLLAAPAVPIVRPDARRAHLVGIGGSGMKALAELLIGLGWQVSGSDVQPSGPVLQLMKNRGLRIHAGHHDRFLPRDADLLIHSPAVGPANPERRLAARLGMPVLSYSQVLGWLMHSRVGVAIAGTHGKSTTTAMTAHILTDAGRDPCIVVGAEPCRGSSGRAGRGELFVVESCEYERSFLDVRPRFAAILAIEPDHFDCYATFAETCGAFAEFAGRVEPGGTLVVRGDCPAAADAARHTPADVVTFSRAAGADWWAADLRA
ncbi:MAG: Mur ligase domain-containing protein, partial [Planctomycetaceae bacterium]